MDEERIPDDPKYLPAAMAITADFGETGTPLSWCIQEDGTLTVILPSGKKVRAGLVPAPSTTPAPTAKPADAAAPPKPTSRSKPARSRTVRKSGN